MALFSANNAFCLLPGAPKVARDLITNTGSVEKGSVDQNRASSGKHDLQAFHCAFVRADYSLIRLEKRYSDKEINVLDYSYNSASFTNRCSQRISCSKIMWSVV